MGYTNRPTNLENEIVMGGPVLSPERARELQAQILGQKEEEARKPKPKSGSWKTEPSDTLNIGAGNEALLTCLYYNPEKTVIIHNKYNEVAALCQKYLDVECPYCGKYFWENSDKEALRKEWPIIFWLRTITTIKTGAVREVNKLVITSLAKNICSPLDQIHNIWLQRLLEGAALHTYDMTIQQDGLAKDARFQVYARSVNPRPFVLPPPWKMPTSLREIYEIIDGRYQRKSQYIHKPEPQQTATPYVAAKRQFTDRDTEGVVFSNDDERNAADPSVDLSQIFDYDEPGEEQAPPPSTSSYPRAKGSPDQWVRN